MPAILINEYEWRQTDDKVFVNAPIFGNPKTVDLFAMNNYVKASYPPFILELFLWGTIVDDESECVLNKAQRKVMFNLKKKESGIRWPSLVAEDLDKVIKNQRRSHALNLARESTDKREKIKIEMRHKLQKRAVRAQINLDTGILNEIDWKRDNERKDAMKDFEDWRSRIEDPILSDVEGKLQDNRKAYRPALKWFKNADGELRSREMTGDEVIDKGIVIAEEEEEKEEENVKSMNKLELNETESLGDDNSEMRSSRAEITNQETNNSSSFDSGKNNIVEICSGKNDNDDSLISFDDCKIHSDVKIDPNDSTTESFVKNINEKRSTKFYEDKYKGKGQGKGKGKGDRNLKIDKPLKTNIIFDDDKSNSTIVPLPRKNGIIDVKFSERKFPTPARESNESEEQEWLEKQAEARRRTGFVVEDLRAEELDPQWLKDKGDEFFKAGNYLGSVSAYSHGIKLSPKMSSLYSNRSAAHYALGNYVRCTEDCSKALELMVPNCKGNLESRAKCHARRGAALCKLSSPQHGIPELEAALKLDPENATIKRDLQAARHYFDMQE